MKAISILLFGAIAFLIPSQGATLSAQSGQPVAKWSFDETGGAVARNSVTGTEDKIDGLLDVLRPFSLREVVRTGQVAIRRGKKATVSAKSDGAGIVDDENVSYSV